MSQNMEQPMLSSEIQSHTYLAEFVKQCYFQGDSVLENIAQDESTAYRARKGHRPEINGAD